jgi:hypothetical protein
VVCTQVFFLYSLYILCRKSIYFLKLFCYSKNKVKDLIRKSNKGISIMIALIGMIALLVVGLGIGYYLNSGTTGTSAEFPEDSEWRIGTLNLAGIKCVQESLCHLRTGRIVCANEKNFLAHLITKRFGRLNCYLSAYVNVVLTNFPTIDFGQITLYKHSFTVLQKHILLPHFCKRSFYRVL